jgi:hypothetical protein
VPQGSVRRRDFPFYTDPVDAALKALGLWGMTVKCILAVCTGNTCRSPMAAALLRDAVRKDPELGAACLER